NSDWHPAWPWHSFRSLLKITQWVLPVGGWARLVDMRGNDQEKEAELFLYGSMEERIPADHPLRAVRRLVDAVLRSMSREFDGLYAKHGRPSIPPERLLRALLLQVFFSIRSERLLMEQIEYNLLFRWFVGMDSCERAWNHAVFSKNRQRLLNQELAQSFFTRVKEQAPGSGSASGEFHGEQRRNQTHASKTDPEARLYRKSNGQEAKLAYLGHVLVENRHGLIAAAMATQADG